VAEKEGLLPFKVIEEEAGEALDIVWGVAVGGGDLRSIRISAVDQAACTD
jgi:hypothetical protein